MARTTVTEFTVEGTGSFPFDMLRYDQAWPARSDDAIAMDRQNWRNGRHPGAERLSIRMRTHGAVTRARWASFGWHVTAEQTWAV